ncbi:hypothetical protein UY3_02238 [Chelonia mydas]|uniref:Uncharacterized protein n=1 Tax=Chelonia mydas TaxID=8469 RepID=M7BXE7_CHEMY|nr:hypothetical protein UY3_02238 [Chelonia mydas]
MKPLLSIKDPNGGKREQLCRGALTSCYTDLHQLGICVYLSQPSISFEKSKKHAPMQVLTARTDSQGAGSGQCQQSVRKKCNWLVLAASGLIEISGGRNRPYRVGSHNRETATQALPRLRKNWQEFANTLGKCETRALVKSFVSMDAFYGEPTSSESEEQQERPLKRTEVLPIRKTK